MSKPKRARRSMSSSQINDYLSDFDDEDITIDEDSEDNYIQESSSTSSSDEDDNQAGSTSTSTNSVNKSKRIVPRGHQAGRRLHSANGTGLPGCSRASDSDSSESELRDVVIQQQFSDESDEEIECPGGIIWDKGPAYLKKLNFSEVSGLKQGITTVDVDNQDIFSYFRLFLTDELLDLIIAETNRYAAQKIAANNQKFLMKYWSNITRPDLLKFLALVLHMGVLQLPRLNMYWSKNQLYRMPFFSGTMSRNRFLQILSCFHLVNNETADQNDKLWRCRPIIDHFNNIMKDIYTPSRELSIDESMILFRGRLGFRQYIKGKKHKYGIKAYMLCENDGLVLKVLIYTGAGTVVGPKGHTFEVVKLLMEDHLNKGHSLYMDNYYNSYELSRDLLKNETYSTGTLSEKRKGNPEEVKAAKLKKGDCEWRHCDGIITLKWKDKRNVTMISSEYPANLKDVTSKRGVMKKKPEAIIEYNRFMSGIDHADQMVSYYDILRKGRKWYKKIFYRLLHNMVVNAFILYKRYSSESSARVHLLDFHSKLVVALVDEAEGAPKPAPLQHFPQYIEKCAEGRSRSARKRCKLCQKQKKETKSPFFCAGCPSKPVLCIDCFPKFAHF